MELRTVLPCAASSVGTARRLVRGELRRSGVGRRSGTHNGHRPGRPAQPGAVVDVTDAACLLVSELVTNAVVHAHTEVSMHLLLVGGVLRAEIADASPVLPAPRTPWPSAAPAAGAATGPAATGRGLQLVDRLASRWGVTPTAAGKTVWFELVVSES